MATASPEPVPSEDGADERWVEAATVKELSRRKKLFVSVAGQKVALFWYGGTAYALRNICMHQQKPLSKGTMLGNRVICPGHQWAFEVQTGYERTQDACQPTYATRVEGDTVYVDPRPRVLVEGTSWTPDSLNK